MTTAHVTLSPRDYDAVLFDLDGVLTRTASVHAQAWKALFDSFLEQRARERGEDFVPFDIDIDYRRYVDGRPRQEGVAVFLASRGIELPAGSAQDPPDAVTMHALGRRKDGRFLELLERQGVGTYESSIELVRTLRGLDIRTAVVSASRNCKAVLDAAGIADLFDTRVDGTDVDRLGLGGKPAPDTFLEAARRLHVDPGRCVVVEDAIAGVEAGRAGGFRFVLGVDRVGRPQALREAGADAVVQDLEQLVFTATPSSGWLLCHEGFDAPREGVRESLCALGNGYFATRGAVPWAGADDVHYPGTYLAGGYNRLQSHVAGRVVENEDLVNLPNWLDLAFRVDGGEWFDLRHVELLEYRQTLDLRCALLRREFRFADAKGRRSRVVESRFVSMADKHLGAMQVELEAENWSGRVSWRSGIDGNVVNAGAKLYEPFANEHLVTTGAGRAGGDALWLEAETRQSRLRIAMAVRTRAFDSAGRRLDIDRRLIESDQRISEEFDLDIAEGHRVTIEKTLALHSSRDLAISECTLAARTSIARAPQYDAALAEHILAWKHLWRRFDVHLAPRRGASGLNVPMLLRLNMFHLLQAASLNSVGLDIGVPARGWTGEAYQGHVFWDELFIFPTLNCRTPEITRSLLMYRYRRLDEARAAAAASGYRGAMYPWQSASDGREETQAMNLNPRSGRFVRDDTYLQRHVGSAIAYNVWHYYQTTLDTEFLQFFGAEMIFEIARFWSSMAVWNAERERYEIRGVVGPDEFHTAYPDADKPGLDNNAYTNIMAVWVLRRALELTELLPPMRRNELFARLALKDEEIERWEALTRRMFVPFHGDGLISQFEGYERLKELDWQAYHDRYGNIQRLELILEAENDNINRYKASKQADVLMLFYLFSSEELHELLARLGYDFDRQSIPRNVSYYDARSSHGSTLSRVVHAWVLARSDRSRAMSYFADALQSDVSDIQQGTTREGVHLGAMAGTVDLVQRVTTGIEITGDMLRLNPQLPPELTRLDMRLRYRGYTLDLRITRDRGLVSVREAGDLPIRLLVCHREHELTDGDWLEFALES